MDNEKISLEYINEPLIQFGNDFLCDDPKKGISVNGFFSIDKAHRHAIHVGILGTRQNVQDCLDWLNKISLPIEASVEYLNIDDSAIIDEEGGIDENDSEFTEEIEDSQEQTIIPANELFDEEENLEENKIFEIEKIQNKKFNPDFPGFNEDSCFKSKFLNDTSNNEFINDRDIQEILNDKNTNKLVKSEAIISLLYQAYDKMLDKQLTKVDVCIIVIPEVVYKKLASILFGKSHINFRRKLKATLISRQNSIPIQIILESTINGTKKNKQDLSMQAWNFTIANYYKSGCIPWAIDIEDKDTCFIGISFHKLINKSNNVLRSSIAQAFNYEGKGLVFVGKQFEWNSKKTRTSAPHLSYEYAKDLIINVLKTYKQINNNKSPNRVVIHKTTEFWDYTDNADFAEVEGFEYGIKEALGENILVDLVTIRSSKLKLFREVGIYPVPRGTLCDLDNKEGILYTTGYIPYFELYPGMHMPKALHINIYSGETTLRKIASEILALSKMNFNNCSYYDSLPITIRFAKRVGEIIQYFPEDKEPPNKYYFYM